ncbi:MAG: cytoplasmic protein [Gammaproteobacteria bacterium]|nr:cytoplasmic protein [Gammaproteobacteria bacterium]
MTTLAADEPRRYELGDVEEFDVIADDTIFEGAAVGETATGSRPLVAGDTFQGFAEQRADNTGGSAGDKRVRVRQHGKVQLPVGSLVLTDVGAPVYASDDNTFTLTEGANSHIGRVVRFVTAGVGIVAFDARKGSLGGVGELTDSSGGTAGDTIAAIGATYDQAEVRNAVASLAARINAVARQIA